MLEKICCMLLGIIPLSAYFSAPPVMVNVFPEPVCDILVDVHIHEQNQRIFQYELKMVATEV